MDNLQRLPGIMRSLWWLLRGSPPNCDALRRFRDRQVELLVRHAYRNVPYYRGLLDEQGLRPEEFTSVDSLCRFPMTEKSTLKALEPVQITDRRKALTRLRTHQTSGSTGIPLTVRTTWYEDRYLAARRLRPFIGWGLRLGDRLARIKILTLENQLPIPLRFLGVLGLVRVTAINAFAPFQEMRDALLALKPQVVQGYPALLDNLAEVMLDADFAAWRPRFLVVGGSTMTGLMRQRIESRFEVPLFEAYGCHEANLVASQCPLSKRLHVVDDAVIVEILKDGAPVQEGEVGEIVLTSLHSFAQPFIRYRIGDTARKGPSPCPACGAPFSTLEGLEGRLQDWIQMKDGTRRSADWLFSALLKHADWLIQFQLEQTDIDHLVLRLQRRREPSAEELGSVRSLLDEFAPTIPHREIAFVSTITPDAGGKLRVCRSSVIPLYG